MFSIVVVLSNNYNYCKIVIKKQLLSHHICPHSHVLFFHQAPILPLSLLLTVLLPPSLPPLHTVSLPSATASQVKVYIL